MGLAQTQNPFDRDKQFAAKRSALIHAAGQAFRRRGYHNTSMREIATSLGLTKAALYYYVKNKEEVLYECHLMAYDAMDEILKTKPSPEETMLDYLQSLYTAFVELLTHSGVSLLTDVNSLTDTNKALVLERRKKIEQKITRIVKQGHKDGSIRAGDPRLIVFYFMGALNWLNAWYDASGPLKGADIAQHFGSQMRAGIAA